MKILCVVCSVALLAAQEPTVEPVRPSAFVALRPYLAPEVPPCAWKTPGA